MQSFWLSYYYSIVNFLLLRWRLVTKKKNCLTKKLCNWSKFQISSINLRTNFYRTRLFVLLGCTVCTCTYSKLIRLKWYYWDHTSISSEKSFIRDSRQGIICHWNPGWVQYIHTFLISNDTIFGISISWIKIYGQRLR